MKAVSTFLSAGFAIRNPGRLTALSICLILALLALPVLAKESADQAAVSPSEKIDALIEKGYREHAVTPNPVISDEVFLRRVYLDLAGRIPSLTEAEAFLNSTGPGKRSQLIADLTETEGYVSHFYNYWADILRINEGLGNGARAAETAYRLWVKNALRKNMPYDKFAYELVSARGHTWENGAVGYYERDRGMPLDNMSNTVRIFLGTRLECAQCHNHPFDKWKQMDYFQMAAFSYNMDAQRYQSPNRDAFQDKVRADMKEERDRLMAKYGGDKAAAKKANEKIKDKTKGGEYRQMQRTLGDLYKPIRYTTVFENDRTLQLPHDYQYDDAKPKERVTANTMFGEDIELTKGQSVIEPYAAWLTSPKNPTFTMVIANRLWKKMMGVGVIEPVDELTDLTEPSNPELMAYLEDLMKDLNYDMREFVRILCNTKTYQRAAHHEEIVAGEPYYFPGPALRRMSAEQIWDSLVGLAIKDPDHYAPQLMSDMTRLEKEKQIYESLEDRKLEDYMALVEKIAKITKSANEEQDQVRDALYKARAAEELDKVKELSRKLGSLRKTTEKQIAEIAYTKVDQGADVEMLLANLGMDQEVMDTLTTKIPKMGKDEVMGMMSSMVPAETSKDERRKMERKLADEQKAWSRYVDGMARASELETPARRGHFLREFGQSDREVIENANDEASVPQALSLLNGPTTEILTNKHSVFSLNLARAESPEQKLRTIYLCMLTREPTEKEMARLLQEVEQHGDEGYENIVWALLNTHQFLFIQ